MKHLISILILALITGSCAPFVDSPFSDHLLRPERDLNVTAVSALANIEDDSVLKFAVYADTHQNYKETDKMVYAVNAETQLDFVVGLGDFTNSSYNLEYDEFIESISLLKFPTINVIGNHDSIGAGPKLYKKAFGPFNFFFDTPSFRLIFFNANNLENTKDFNPQWLKDRVDETSKKVIIFSHIQLSDEERFSGDDALILNSVIQDAKVKVLFNGHDHVYHLFENNGTIMMQCGRVEGQEKVHWLKVTLQANQFCVQRMDTMENVCKPLK